ncbi:MAG: class I SAM-dependent methyltransferase [Salinibacter sp.]
MSLYQRFFAHTLAWGDDAQHRVYADRKRTLFADVAGTVVEIGPGTGVNLPYLPDGLRWIGLEPNPHMHSFIQDRLDERALDATLRTDPAQDTGLPPESVDVVISTLVLCSVPDVAGTLAELRRILRPGGRLLFIEHVAAERHTPLCWCQHGIRPLWKAVADGCHPDRETGTLLQQSGFSSVEFDRFSIGVPPVSPHIVGTATK